MLGVVHLPPLWGSPPARGSRPCWAHALREARELSAGVRTRS
ncbi:MAG: hypothetical protein R3F62_26470 [Planctomycetota bacterium]